MCTNIVAILFLLKKTGRTNSFLEVEPLSAQTFKNLHRIDGIQGPDLSVFLERYYFNDNALKLFLVDLQSCIHNLKSNEITLDMWMNEMLNVHSTIWGEQLLNLTMEQ